MDSTVGRYSLENWSDKGYILKGGQFVLWVVEDGGRKDSQPGGILLNPALLSHSAGAEWGGQELMEVGSQQIP